MKIEITIPLKQLGVNQLFGNPDPKYKELNLPGHNGIDFTAPHGTPIYASHDGEAYYEIDSKGGHGVVIVSKPVYDLGKKKVSIKTIYWHMVDPDKESHYASPVDGFTPEKTKSVKQGDLIGYADNTGFSSGAHLHFGLKLLDRVGNTLNYNNGYYGAIDPKPYFTNWAYEFPRNLGVGDEGEDVKKLQQFLNKHAFLVAAAGAGSPGNETTFFGGRTREALKKYQKFHGIWATGYFGDKTRLRVNRIILA